MQRAIRTSFLLLVMLVASVSSQATWLYYGEIVMPTTTLDCRWPICLGADDSRDIIYIGMFNDSGADLARNVVRLTLSDALNGTFENIHTRTAAQGRGFCGLAYDETGDALYVTGDSSSTVSYIDKISAPHTGASPAVVQWATPSFRSVGCDLALDTADSTLYLMVSGLVGGNVNAYDTTDESVDTTVAALSGNYARDLVMDPSNYNIYCNRNGNLQAISGGSPSNMAGL